MIRLVDLHAWKSVYRNTGHRFPGLLELHQFLPFIVIIVPLGFFLTSFMTLIAIAILTSPRISIIDFFTGDLLI